MGKVTPLRPHQPLPRRPNGAIHFTRSELHQLLSLYSRRVARGEWRDYAIDQRGGAAAFSVFRHTHDRPLYTITKRWSWPRECMEYLVFRDHRRVARASRLDEALRVIERRLRVVS